MNQQAAMTLAVILTACIALVSKYGRRLGLLGLARRYPMQALRWGGGIVLTIVVLSGIAAGVLR